MKELVFGISTLLFFTFVGFVQVCAIPAFPGKMKARQADGSLLTIQKFGDEHCHIVITEDGYPLVFNAASRNYEYARLSQGSLISSGIIATNVEGRDVEASHFLADVNKEAVMKLFYEKHSKAIKQASSGDIGNGRSGVIPRKTVRITNVPTIGKHDVLVILVQFTDRKFSMDNPADYYQRFFHQKGFSDNGAQGSVYDYYSYGSNGKYDPQFKVYGPITVGHSYRYYSGTGGMYDTYKMIQEVVPMVDTQYDVDFHDFDTDGDGKVDNVYCIYAGYGQADSYDASSIWPHSANLSHLTEAGLDESFSVDGVTIDRYTVSQEINGQTNLTCGIGTFVHEFGHVLGLADYYNNQNTSATNQLGAWDVMASGAYNHSQNRPPTFSAFERYSLGWQDLVPLSTTTDTLVDVKPYENGGDALRVSVPGKIGEYFIIENRQQKGWDASLPGHGLLIWHIDEDQAIWNQNKPNYETNHQRVDIVEADGRTSVMGKAGDTFPGSSNITSYNFLPWQSDSLLFGFAWLQENPDSTAMFLLSGTDFKLESPTIEVDSLMGTSALFHWNASNSFASYTIQLMGNGNLIAEHTTTDNYFKVKGLVPLTQYTAYLTANLGSLRSESTQVQFSTVERQIEEKQVVALPAANVSSTSFTAQWEPIPEATIYDISLFSRTQEGVKWYGTGFDGYSQQHPSLPEGWSISGNGAGSNQNYGENKPSARMKDNGATLTISYNGEKLQKLRFWHKANTRDIGLKVTEFSTGGWHDVANLHADDTETHLDTLNLNGADSVKIVLVRDKGASNAGYILLDDIYVSTLDNTYNYLNTTSVKVGTDWSGSVCSWQYTDLDPNTSYAYTIRAKDGNRVSLQSDTINVSNTATGIVFPTQYINTNRPSADIYDLQGRKVNNDKNLNLLNPNLPKGIYIIGRRKVIIP